MENKKLTKTDKDLLFKLLKNNRNLDTEILELKNNIINFGKEKIYKYLKDKVFKDHQELFINYIKVRPNYRKPVYTLKSTINNLAGLSGYPKLSSPTVDSKNLIKELIPEDHIGCLNECIDYVGLSLVPNLYIDLGWPTDCPSIDSLKQLSEKLGIKDDVIVLEYDFLTILSPDEKNDLLNMVAEYVHLLFISYNYLREYHCPNTTTIHKAGDFLWKINSWEELKTLNEDWYNLLQKEVEELSLEVTEKDKFNLSGKSTKEILDDLDIELGL